MCAPGSSRSSSVAVAARPEAKAKPRAPLSSSASLPALRSQSRPAASGSTAARAQVWAVPPVLVRVHWRRRRAAPLPAGWRGSSSGQLLPQVVEQVDARDQADELAVIGDDGDVVALEDR